ncbi:hypothetical protein [Terrabacter sp. NPDC080008]|uniref:hypothetical protein n=1 Tax=Terrabacter sp. NPDC080008 TaxID=3155176 RepID=UPI00344CC7BE
MSTVPRALPRALRRARLWTTGLLTASTVLVGVIGIHLAEDHAHSLAQSSSAASGSGSGSSSSGSSGSAGFSNQGFSDQGSSNQGFSNSGSDQGSSAGFAPVAPLGGSGFSAQSNSGGS